MLQEGFSLARKVKRKLLSYWKEGKALRSEWTVRNFVSFVLPLEIRFSLCKDFFDVKRVLASKREI